MIIDGLWSALVNTPWKGTILSSNSKTGTPRKYQHIQQNNIAFHVYTWVWKYMCIYVCVWRPEVRVRNCLLLPLPQFGFWDRISHWTWRSPILPDWLDPRGTLFPGAEIIGVNCSMLFTCMLGMELRSQTLHHPHHLPSPGIEFLSNHHSGLNQSLLFPSLCLSLFSAG